MKNRIFCGIAAPLLLLPVLLLATGCDKYNVGNTSYDYIQTSSSFATLNNYSSRATVWYIPEKQYADSFPETLSEWQKIDVYEIEARSSHTLTFDSDDNYVTPIETYGASDSMVFYVFFKSDWDSFSWKELCEGKMWAGKCTLTAEQLVKASRTVTYPFP